MGSSGALRQPSDADLDSLAAGGATATAWMAALLNGTYAPAMAAPGKASAGTSNLGLPGAANCGATTSISLAGGQASIYAPFEVEKALTISAAYLEVITLGGAGAAVDIYILDADAEWQPVAGTARTVATGIAIDAGAVKATTGLAIALTPGRYVAEVWESANVGNGALRGYPMAVRSFGITPTTMGTTVGANLAAYAGVIHSKWTDLNASTTPGVHTPVLFRWAES